MLKKFNSPKIAVIGDIILDHYIEGKVNRISPEAPVPVVNYQKEYYRLGGAANVFLNLKELGVDAKLFGIIGKDREGEKVIELLESITDTNSLVVSNQRKTIIKTRVTSLKQQLLRIDKEETHPIEMSIIEELIEKIKLFQLDGVIFSDYNKGFFYRESFSLFKEYTNQKKIFTVLDPKPRNNNFYTQVSVMTPNHYEAAQLVKEKVNNDDENIITIGKKIISQYNLQHLVITRGEKGVILFEEKEKFKLIPAIARSVFDVSGAGDTIIAVFTACYLNGFSLQKSAEIANIAAGEVIAKFGTSSISFEELNRVCGDFF